MKDNCNPIFDEQFEYVVSQADLNSRILEVSVCTQKGWLSTGSNVMGQVHINLNEIDVTKSFTSWYDLQPETKDQKFKKSKWRFEQLFICFRRQSVEFPQCDFSKR